MKTFILTAMLGADRWLGRCRHLRSASAAPPRQHCNPPRPL